MPRGLQLDPAGNRLPGSRDGSITGIKREMNWGSRSGTPYHRRKSIANHL